MNDNFFNEFVVEVSDADKYLDKLKEANIIGGIKLDDKKVLVAVTEMISDEDIDLYLTGV